jgi:hypothetical protein
MADDNLTPDERHAWNLLVDLIHDELVAQIAIGRLDNPDGKRQTASLIADMVWRAFELRPKPRHQRTVGDTPDPEIS